MCRKHDLNRYLTVSTPLRASDLVEAGYQPPRAQHAERYVPSTMLFTAKICLACPHLFADALQGGYGGGDGGRGKGEELLHSPAACTVG